MSSSIIASAAHDRVSHAFPIIQIARRPTLAGCSGLVADGRVTANNQRIEVTWVSGEREFDCDPKG